MKIGDKVVCVKSHSERAVIKGQEFTITGVPKSCECNSVTVGVLYPEYHRNKDCYCSTCGNDCRTGLQYELDVVLFRKLATHPNFKSEISEELANTPLVKETIEKVKQKELV